MKKSILIAVVLIIVAVFFVYIFRGSLVSQFFKPTETNLEEGVENTEAKAPEVIVENLDIPWEIVFLPSGEMLVTERAGKLVLIDEDKTIIPVSGVTHRGEGGLLGLTLHPNFLENNFIYLYMTTEGSSGLTNRVERYKLSNTTLSDRKIIIENIPGASNHDGGRIAFGPDGMLYIATGDAGREDSAQDTKSLAGKILRVNDDGSVPSDNPFGNAVYSYGHRNVQGIAWDEDGTLWATEHGRSGVQSGFDEINKIVKGKNYGWPEIEGDESQEDMVAPEVHSGTSETWAPSGMAYINDRVVFAGLRGESLYVSDISTGRAEDLKIYLKGEYGRLRTVSIGRDGMIYVLTNNKDGRGSPEVGDDRIIKIDPRMLGL